MIFLSLFIKLIPIGGLKTKKRMNSIWKKEVLVWKRILHFYLLSFFPKFVKIALVIDSFKEKKINFYFLKIKIVFSQFTKITLLYRVKGQKGLNVESHDSKILLCLFVGLSVVF